MISLGGGAYSGSVHTNNLIYYSAGTLDYSGRTIWVDVSGITRTNDLIITNSPAYGYVWTCIDGEGKGEWAPTGAGSGYWSATTLSFNNGIVVINSNSVALGQYSLCEGLQNSSIGVASHAEGFLTTASGITSHSEGYNTTARGSYSHAEGSGTAAIGDASHAEGSGTTANGIASFAGGVNTLASGVNSFAFGNNSQALADGTIVLGEGLTGNNKNTVFVSELNIKTVASGPATIDIGVDANGNVVNTASDISLKENVVTIDSALDKVKLLRGVYFDWIDKNSGGNDRKIGFIAQEVEKIVPELVYTHSNGVKVVHYKDVVALLTEAIKELSSSSMSVSNTHLETQSIVAEDNNIDLNFGGNQETAIEGGIRVLHALGIDKSAELLIDSNGNWTTNNGFAPLSITIPNYTPSSSNDENGSVGNITRDENYFYIKTKNGWKRSMLESF